MKEDTEMCPCNGPVGGLAVILDPVFRKSLACCEIIQPLCHVSAFILRNAMRVLDRVLLKEILKNQQPHKQNRQKPNKKRFLRQNGVLITV